MRIRTLKPEWLDDEQIVLASDAARVLSIALILLADDYGNGRANERLLCARIFPGQPAEKLRRGLSELAEIGFTELYSVREQDYFHICNWTKHQRIDNAGKARVPGPLEADEKGPRNLAESRGETPPDLDPDPDPDHDREAAASRGNSDIPEGFSLLREYKSRYEAKRPGVVWEKWAMYGQAFADIKRQAAAQDCDTAEALTRSLDNFFADAKQAEFGDYSPSSLAKQFTRYFSPPVIQRKDEPDPEAINAKRTRERQQDQELHEKLAGHSEGAVKPPDALDAMLAGIGREVGEA